MQLKFTFIWHKIILKRIFWKNGLHEASVGEGRVCRIISMTISTVN